MFVMFRLIFGGLIFVICFALISRSAHKQRSLMAALFAAAAVTTISALIPIENAFVTFSSPQSAYNYKNSADVKLIVSGENADLVIGSKSDGYIYDAVPKSDKGWKIGMGLDTKMIARTFSDGISVHVYRYKDSEDYFIEVSNSKPGPLEIADNRSSEFQFLERYNTTLNETFYTYYAHIDGYNEQYELTVNGETIKIPN